MPDNTMTGTELRDRRHKLDLTQEQLARLLGVTVNTIARWERGCPIGHPTMLDTTLRMLEHERSRAHPGTRTE